MKESKGKPYKKYLAELKAEVLAIAERQELSLKEIGGRSVAGLFLTGLMDESMKTPEHEKRCDSVRDGYVVLLRVGQDRLVHINMASGFSCHAQTRYRVLMWSMS